MRRMGLISRGSSGTRASRRPLLPVAPAAKSIREIRHDAGPGSTTTTLAEPLRGERVSKTLLLEPLITLEPAEVPRTDLTPLGTASARPRNPPASSQTRHEHLLKKPRQSNCPC